jgi:hypothetical protein
MRSACVFIEQVSGNGSLEELFEVWRLSIVPVCTFSPVFWMSIALRVTVGAVSFEDKELVVVDKVAFHLGEERLECKELASLPSDEGCNVKFLAKTLLSSSESPLEDWLHAASVTKLVAPVDSVATSKWLPHCNLLDLPCAFVFVLLFLSFLNEKCL